MTDVVREKLKLLPDRPGVYIMLDGDGTVIYVGKARVLKNRVRQYFHSSAKPVKVQAMVDCIADFSYIVTPSEVDALALENTYIKKYKPKYNILLKDDKTYPYIKLTKEDYPRLVITRKVKKGDGRYFGPFMAGIAAKDVIEIAARVCHVRTCAVAVTEKPKKPCLEYHLGRCGAPCAHAIDKDAYMAQVEKAIAFLSGDYEEAQALLDGLAPGEIIEKLRHTFEYEGSVWEVDEFLGANRGLIVAEIELDAEDQAFSRPPWLGEEVSKVSRYLNVELSRLPYTAWNQEEKEGKNS